MPNTNRIKHLALIMDGNRRWAKQRSLASIEGHKAGVQSLKRLVSIAPNHGIEYLTVYAFSTENWRRDKNEVGFLFDLLAEVAIKELNNLKDNNVCVNFIGNLNAFDGSKVLKSINQLSEATKNNTGLKLQIALNYGSIEEFNHAIQSMRSKLSKEEIASLDEEQFSELLYTAKIPDPNMLIRTGGDKRLSNFLLWQAANAELKFIDTLWPDFDEDKLRTILNGTN
jgi:undecaprenyl diphosphate synthase